MPKPSGRKSSFKYAPTSTEEVHRRANQSSGRYDSIIKEQVTWFKPAEGDNEIRLMPWLSAEDPKFEEYDEKWGNYWGISVMVHYDVGADKGQYLCLGKEGCPICEAHREGEEKLKPSDRFLCWLVDRDDEDAGPKLWSMPLSVMNDISDASQVKGGDSDDGAVLQIADPFEGYDVSFKRVGTQINTKYKRIEVARKASPLGPSEKTEAKWLDYVMELKLPDILNFRDEDYLTKVLEGQISSRRDDDDAGDDDDGDNDRSSSRRARGGDREDRTEARRPRRGGDADGDDDRGSRRERGGRDREETRPARRGREEAAPDDGGGEEEVLERPAREARGARRSERGSKDPDPEDEPADEAASDAETTSRRPRGGGVERRRSREESEETAEDVADSDESKDVATARERLGRVGRGRR